MLACFALTRDHEIRRRRGELLRNRDAPCRTVARDFVSPRAPRRIATIVAASRAGHERRLRGALKRPLRGLHETVGGLSPRQLHGARSRGSLCTLRGRLAESAIRSIASSSHARAAITGRPVVGPYQSPVFGRHRARRNMWSLGMTTEKRGSDSCCFREASEGGGFVHREGGFRVPKPCQRPTGLSGGMPHGEGRRPSSRGGITTRWTARSAGRQGFGCLWSRVAQIHICWYMRGTQMQAICRIPA